MAGSHPIALDADRHVGLQSDRQICPARVGDVAIVDDSPLGRDPPVVEDRLARQLHLDFTLQARSNANQEMIGVLVHRRAGVRRDAILAIAGPEGEGVAHEHPAARCVPGRVQDVRSRLVYPR